MALSDMFPPEAFVWGAGGARKTPEEIAREREIAEALLAQGIDSSPVHHPLQGIARVANAAAGAYGRHRAGQAEQGNAQYSQSLIEQLMGGGGFGGGGANPSVANTGSTIDFANAGDIRTGIVNTAQALGIDPVDLATAISYETAGTFDPTKRGPTTQWGQHRGLIQFGEPQARQHGVDWNDPIGSQLGPDGAIAKYLRSTGVKPGMGMLDIYSAINAGGVGRYNASDANNGGAPGTVADKVNSQMAGHRQKALALLGQEPAQVPQQVASLDPSIGMPPEAMAPPQQTAGISIGDPPVQGMSPQAVPATAVQPAQVPPVAPMAVPGVDAPQQPPQPVQQVAQAMMPREEMSGNVDMQQPMGGGMGGMNPVILEALSSPYVNDNVRNIAGILLQQQMQQQDPMRQMEMERMQLEMEQMRNPQPEYDFITGRDGSIFRTQKGQGTVEQVYGGKPDQPTDVQEYEYARGQGYQGSFADWQIENKKAGASQVNIDQRAEGAFEKKAAEGQAEVFNTMSSEGMNARADLGVIGELETLLAGQGGAMTGIAGIAAKYGIGGEGMSDIQAAQALINKLVPTQRQAGSGSMSDRDVELFTRSLPNLWNSPQGNQKIIKVMRGLAQYKQDQGEIADMVLMGEKTRQEGRKALRELPNPLEEFRNMPAQSGGGIPEGIDPSLWDAMTPEEKALWN
jgi:hypothetical protein